MPSARGLSSFPQPPHPHQDVGGSRLTTDVWTRESGAVLGGDGRKPGASRVPLATVHEKSTTLMVTRGQHHCPLTATVDERVQGGSGLALFPPTTCPRVEVLAVGRRPPASNGIPRGHSNLSPRCFLLGEVAPQIITERTLSFQ